MQGTLLELELNDNSTKRGPLGGKASLKEWSSQLKDAQEKYIVGQAKLNYDESLTLVTEVKSIIDYHQMTWRNPLLLRTSSLEEEYLVFQTEFAIKMILIIKTM